MFDIYKQKAKINCPSCKEEIEVTLKQCLNEETIICICNTKIDLIDKNGEAKNNANKIDESFKKLEKTIKKSKFLNIKKK